MALPRFRLLSVTMLMATGMLGVKLLDIVQGGQALSNALLVSEATAESKEAPKEEAKTEEKKDDKEEAKPEGEHGKAEGEHGKKEPGKPAVPSAVSDTPPDTVKMTGQGYTQNEVEILQNLSKRREQLEQWAKELELKDNVLQATEQRIDQKLANMQSLKTQVDALLVTFNTQEDAKIKSLVKIYENMKAKDAAGIFEQTDMPVLLLLIDKMSERKVAPILASMNPKKAMQVTAELAAQRKLQAIPANTDTLPDAVPAKAPAPAAPPAAKPEAAPAAAEKPAEPKADEKKPAENSEAKKPAEKDSEAKKPE